MSGQRFIRCNRCMGCIYPVDVVHVSSMCWCFILADVTGFCAWAAVYTYVFPGPLCVDMCLGGHWMMLQGRHWRTSAHGTACMSSLLFCVLHYCSVSHCGLLFQRLHVWDIVCLPSSDGGWSFSCRKHMPHQFTVSDGLFVVYSCSQGRIVYHV